MRVDINRPLSVDIHLHTVNSGHAFSTLCEYVGVARERETKIIGVADHGPFMEGAAAEGYFTMGGDARRASSEDCTVLFGCELNILSKRGDVDLTASIIEKLDYTFAGLHDRTPYTASAGNSELENTQAIVNCIQKVRPTIISHPITASFPVEILPIVEAAASYSVALEINARLFKRLASRYLVRSYIRLLELALQYQVSIILSSDSHLSIDVGDVSSLSPLQKAINEASKLIVNLDEHTFRTWQNEQDL